MQEPQTVRVLLVDHSVHVGSDMGEEAQGVIEEALASMGIETRVGVAVDVIDPDGVTLSSGEPIPAVTIVWCAGKGAIPLTLDFAVEPDSFGRLPVDVTLRVKGVANVFAAGDVVGDLFDSRCCRSVFPGTRGCWIWGPGERSTAKAGNAGWSLQEQRRSRPSGSTTASGSIHG